MTEKLKKRWTIVCVVWIGALILTFVNNIQIDHIIVAREKAEILQKDQIFWNKNAENINNILKKWESAFQHVESLKLGLLSVENQLVALAGQKGLANVKISTRSDQGTEMGVPADISFKGPFNGAMKWLNTLEKDYPFLPLQRLAIKVDDAETKSEFNASFYYRYQIIGQEEAYY